MSFSQEPVYFWLLKAETHFGAPFMSKDFQCSLAISLTSYYYFIFIFCLEFVVLDVISA